MKREARIEATQRVFDGFLKIDELRFTRQEADGTVVGPCAQLVMSRGDAAAVLLHNVTRDTIILAEQFRVATLGAGPGWLEEIAAGGIEASEAAEAAARREVREELGYKLESLEPIVAFYPSPGGSSERIHVFYARVASDALEDPATVGADPGEHVAPLELGVDAFLDRIARGLFQDAKTIIAGQWLALRRAATPGRRPRAR